MLPHQQHCEEWPLLGPALDSPALLTHTVPAAAFRPGGETEMERWQWDLCRSFQEVETGIVDNRGDPNGQAVTTLERMHIDALAESVVSDFLDPAARVQSAVMPATLPGHRSTAARLFNQ
jgi:hypothetical protein